MWLVGKTPLISIEKWNSESYKTTRKHLWSCSATSKVSPSYLSEWIIRKHGSLQCSVKLVFLFNPLISYPGIYSAVTGCYFGCNYKNSVSFSGCSRSSLRRRNVHYTSSIHISMFPRPFPFSPFFGSLTSHPSQCGSLCPPTMLLSTRSCTFLHLTWAGLRILLPGVALLCLWSDTAEPPSCPVWQHQPPSEKGNPAQHRPPLQVLQANI